MTHYEELKDLHRSIRHTFPNDLSVRIHRALSWLQRAEMEENDSDASFIFHWISFNAAYAGNFAEQPQQSEFQALFSFFEKIVENDKDRLVYNLIWQRFSQEIKGVLDNKFIFSSYWRFSDDPDDLQWANSFAAAKTKANHALASQDTCTILSILFSRVYVLRNQIFHGNATWNSSLNRRQLIDCEKILGALLPVLIRIMMDNPTDDWGSIAYPVQTNQ